MSRRSRRRRARSRKKNSPGTKAHRTNARKAPDSGPPRPPGKRRGPAADGTPAPPRDSLERVLRAALFGALGLLLLTPFVVTPGTVYPFVVGKALWSRSLIEIAFALWAVLALARPGYRPPGSWLLALLAGSVGVSLLSAAFGVSPRHSLWSDYERMLGVVDQAHWCALAVVLAAVLRTASQWRALLGASVAAGSAMACLVIARALDIEVPFFGSLPENHRGRLGGPFGNPTFLAAYLLVNAVLAAGFAARAWTAGFPAVWLGAVALHLGALLLAGSVAGFAGLIGAAGFALLAFAWLGRGRQRLACLALLAALAAAGAAAGARFLDSGRTTVAAVEASAAQWPGGRALRYMGGVHLSRPSVQSRLAAWRAGGRGFAERPLLGWGPGNYATVFGLFGTGYAAAAEPHDQAHGKLVEVAATTGTAGLAAWLALWGLALAVLLRAARARESPERTLTVFVAAALAGHLIQAQFLFDTAAGTLLATALLAFAVAREPLALPPAWRPRLPAGLLRRARNPLRYRGARVALGAGAVGLALWGLGLNLTVRTAADARHVTGTAIPDGVTAEGIDAFPALGTFYRKFLFSELTRNWPTLSAENPALAASLLGRAEREAAAALAHEPWNWHVEHLLAQLYAAVAATDPGYASAAERHLERARELAPARAVFPAPLKAPAELAATRLPDGRLELSWRPSPGAGYHQIARADADGAWRTVLYSYDPARSVYRAPAGANRYRIKACRYPADCSAWVRWP